MIEGVVTASNVGFQKFSKDLIPTVCQVNVSVDALYIGFAQRNAYLTKQLEESASEAANQKEADDAEIKAIQQKLDAKIGRIDTNYNRLLAFGIDGINLQTLGDTASAHSQVPASSSALWKYQWDTGTNYGIRLIPAFKNNIVIPIFGDPTASNYGQIRNTILTTSFTIPASGYYIIGTFVENANPVVTGTAGSQYTLSGWWRSTTGNAHVLNTDWIEVRALTGT